MFLKKFIIGLKRSLMKPNWATAGPGPRHNTTIVRYHYSVLYQENLTVKKMQFNARQEVYLLLHKRQFGCMSFIATKSQKVTVSHIYQTIIKSVIIHAFGWV